MNEPNSAIVNNDLLVPSLNQPRVEMKKEIHVCGVCSKEFKLKKHLMRHQFVHLTTKAFSCEVT